MGRGKREGNTDSNAFLFLRVSGTPCLFIYLFLSFSSARTKSTFYCPLIRSSVHIYACAVIMLTLAEYHPFNPCA